MRWKSENFGSGIVIQMKNDKIVDSEMRDY